MVSLLALTTRVPINFEARHCPGCSCVTKLPCADEAPPAVPLAIDEPEPDALVPDDIVPAPAEPDVPAAPDPADMAPELAAPPAEVDPEPVELAAVLGAPGPGLPPDADDIPPDPDEPGMALPPLPGTMAGEPDVGAPEPDAVGRSADGVESGPVDWGAVVCAKAGAARAVARRQAAMCFLSMDHSPEGAGNHASRAQQTNATCKASFLSAAIHAQRSSIFAQPHLWSRGCPNGTAISRRR
jgi:hypothetical protein